MNIETRKKELRLYKKSHFDKVFGGKKKKISQDGFVVFFCSNALSYNRLGIIISKKNVKNATQRNRIKRIIRESFRLNYSGVGAENFEGKKGIDLVFVVYSRAEKLTNAELRLCVEKLMHKITS